MTEWKELVDKLSLRNNKIGNIYKYFHCSGLGCVVFFQGKELKKEREYLISGWERRWVLFRLYYALNILGKSNENLVGEVSSWIF